MARFTLHAVAPDQPGIVASVTQALADIGCNLEDSRMTRLHGRFSIVLVLEAPGVQNGNVIEESLSAAFERHALQYLVCPVPTDPIEPEEELVSLRAAGNDHPGTVAGIARVISEAGGNIVDLVGHVAPDAETPSLLYVVAAVPPAAIPGLRAAAAQLAEDLEMHCELEEHAKRPL